MLKRFREENINAFEEISKEIDRVVDSWVSELLSSMVSTPMDPSAKRSLWDRFKGTLSNLWYGGRYNPKNPYYWKHRFGDELGANVTTPPPLPKQESFDPSIFTLQEYYQLKSAIDDFENNISINEQELPGGAEKLQLVQKIKLAAEQLKKNLKDIFAKSQEQTPAATEAPKRKRGRPPKIKPTPAAAATPPDTRGIDPRLSVRGGLENPPVSYEVGSEELYKSWLPKETNRGKKLKDLRSNKQYVDVILHPDYSLKDFYNPDIHEDGIEKEANKKINALEKLKRDAIKSNESNMIINKIDEAIDKIKRLSKEGS